MIVSAVVNGRTVIEQGVAELARPLRDAWHAVSDMVAERHAA